MLRLGILASTRGTDMLAIVAAIQQNQLSASISVVISNKSDAIVLERAKASGLNSKFIDPKHLTREAYDEKVSAELLANQVDLVVLIGYMRILTEPFFQVWRHKIINVHPSLLPEFAGGMDQNVHQAVIASGAAKTGCTVHYVTEELDVGPILIQKSCNVYLTDTPDTLKTRVQKLEGEALIEAIQKIS
jgi:phosphoribosylglycinamide formyltransferase-1